jgi:hypothetical protein
MTTKYSTTPTFPYENYSNGFSPMGTATGLKHGAMGVGLAFALVFTGTTSGMATQILPRVEPRAVDRPISPFPSSGRGTQSVGLSSAKGLGQSEELLSHADSVRWLHAESGLTWDQLGRLFGVSRRAVHFWATGGKLNATNVELLRQLTEIVRGLDANTPTARRDLLLTFGADGKSIVEKFRTGALSNQIDIQGTPFSPWSVLGAVHDRNA